MVDGSIGCEKTALIIAASGTPVAFANGMAETTADAGPGTDSVVRLDELRRLHLHRMR